MRFGSVCSGIEAASVAWEPLGWQAAWLAEIEPFPCAVLAHHYPEVPNHGDMTGLPQLIRSGKVEAPDLFCGGTPCQAFSVAGLRKSLDDARGNLSLTFCEIANAIDHVRRDRGDQPCVVFWENVPGVLSTKDNAFGCFLAGLAGEDDALVPPGGKWTDAGVVLGPARAVAWRILDAQYFGVAQRRKRVFVVASAREDFDPAAVLFEWEGVRRDSAPSREAGEVAARGAAAGAAFGGNRTSGSIDITPALLAQPGSGWKGDFESETFITQPAARMHKGIDTTLDEGHTPVLAFDTYNQTASDTAQTLCSRGDTPGGNAHLVPAVVQPYTLAIRGRGEGFDASEDGTGRGTPLVPVAFAETAPTLSVGAHGAAGHPHRQHGNETAIVGMTAWRCPDCGHTQQYNHRGCRLFSAHAFDARQSDVLQYGDKAGPLDTDGHSIGVAIPIDTMNHLGRGDSHSFGDFQPGAPSYTLTKGHSHAVAVAVRTANTSANGHGISAELAHTLDQAQGQAVLAPTLTATNDPSRSPQSSEITAQVAAVVQATAVAHVVNGNSTPETATEMAFPLRADDGSGNRQAIQHAMQVRRLTPRECERLQGFPDGYTAIPWRGKPASECPDGPRYKALGNSWAVPCVRWIGRRIAAQIA